MNAQPLVSIIMSCYNSERFLPQVLDSVRAQTYTNWELVAGKDLSSDSTAALLSTATAADPRIHHIDRETRGGRLGATKNTGVQHARGEFIAFLDHDDLYLPRKIKQPLSLRERHPQCVAAFHDLKFIDVQGRPGSRHLPKLIKAAPPVKA
jgi:teichuronic acid biosynthesis glycosyltransferase TuaG